MVPILINVRLVYLVYIYIKVIVKIYALQILLCCQIVALNAHNNVFHVLVQNFALFVKSDMCFITVNV
jgi:hypothetical protein